MTGLVRKATLLVVFGLLATAAIAQAGVPSPANCTLPTFVDLVACDGTGNLPTAAAFKATVVVRDISNNPVVGATIALSFCTDVKIYSAVPGGAVVCPVFTNTAVTDGTGSATVEISGAGFAVGGVTFGTNGINCVTWFANGIAIGLSNVATYDEDGATALAKQGVAGSDALVWVGDKTTLPAVYRSRSDYNHNGSVDGPDIVLWVNYKTALPAFTSSCGTLCP